MFHNSQKIVALALAIHLAFCQSAFAASPRDILSKAKASFDSPEARRGGSLSADQLESSQAAQTAHINQLQAIQDLEKLNFEAGDPVLVTTINTQNYASSSGTVYNYPNDVLVMYGNRSVNYALNILEEGDYSIKLSTAQMTSKNAPPDYLFNFHIKVDGVTVANVNLNSSRVLTPSDFIDLGSLAPGAHTLTLQWINDTNTSPYDANVGVKGIELYEASSPPEPNVGPILVNTFNPQNYASSSGTVYKYPNDALVMYGNRLVDYALNIADEKG